jgi:DNA-binding LacI/PurR family transcriptional regulator
MRPLQLRRRPTAIFAINNLMGMGALLMRIGKHLNRKRSG